jgi:hypothetical protein
MSEFTVLINTKTNLPLGLLQVFLVSHEFFKYENGDPVIEWEVRAFPIKFKWIQQFGNLKNQLNRYTSKEKIAFSLNPDVIINPVSLQDAINLSNKFVKLLISQSELWTNLAIRWPGNCTPEEDNYQIYLDMVTKEYQMLSTNFYNHQHYNMDEKPFITIAWDVFIRNLLFDNHVDYFDLFSKPNSHNISDDLSDDSTHDKFLSYEEISKLPPLYDCQFTREINTHNLNEIFSKIIDVYEVNEDQFFEEVNIDFIYNKKKAKFIYIPFNAEIVNYGIYMLLEGDNTRHVYINLRKDTLKEFNDTIREYTGAPADDENDD